MSENKVKRIARKVYFTMAELERIRDRMTPPFKHRDSIDQSILNKINHQMSNRRAAPLGVTGNLTNEEILLAERHLLQRIAKASQTSADPEGQLKLMQELITEWEAKFGESHP